MKRLIILFAYLVFLACPELVEGQVKIGSDGSVQPTGNFSAMHGEYVDGVLLTKDTSDIPGYQLVTDSTYTIVDGSVYKWNGSNWELNSFADSSFVSIQVDTIKPFNNSDYVYLHNGALADEDYTPVAYGAGNILLTKSMRSIDGSGVTDIGSSANYYDDVYADNFYAVTGGYKISLSGNGNSASYFNGGELKLKNFNIREQNTFYSDPTRIGATIQMEHTNSGTSGLEILSCGSLGGLYRPTLNLVSGMGYAQSMTASTVDLIKIYNATTHKSGFDSAGIYYVQDQYKMPHDDGSGGQVLTTDGLGGLTFENRVNNLEDDGVNVVNSASGTGRFQWDEVIVNADSISSNSNLKLGSGDSYINLNSNGEVDIVGGRIGYHLNINNTGNEGVNVDGTIFQNGIIKGAAVPYIDWRPKDFSYKSLGVSNYAGRWRNLHLIGDISYSATSANTITVLQLDDNSGNYTYVVPAKNQNDTIAFLSDLDGLGGGLSNLEDNSNNVVNSATGTGYFNWDYITLDNYNLDISHSGGISTIRIDNTGIRNTLLDNVIVYDNLIPQSSGSNSLGINSVRWGKIYVDKIHTDTVNINDYTLPTSDGTSGQVMTTDGSGNLSFSNVYESGTFTPTFVSEGGALSSSSSIYTLVGNLLTINITASFSANAVGQPLQITLPFTVETQSPTGAVGIMAFRDGGVTTDQSMLTAWVLTTGTQSLIRVDETDGTDILYSGLGGETVSFSGTFRCADCTP